MTSTYDHTGILPPPFTTNADDLIGDEANGDFVLQWVMDVSDDPLTLAAISQAQQQFRTLFPDAEERDQIYFMAGLSTMVHWWAFMSNSVREQHLATLEPHELDDQVCPGCGGLHDIFLSLDEADAWMGLLTQRLVTTVFGITDDPDLDDAFADLIESIMRGDDAGNT